MTDLGIKNALQVLQTRQGSIEVEADSILNAGGTDAQIAQRCVDAARAGQTVAITALRDAGELARI